MSVFNLTSLVPQTCFCDIFKEKIFLWILNLVFTCNWDQWCSLQYKCAFVKILKTYKAVSAKKAGKKKTFKVSYLRLIKATHTGMQ